MNKGTKGAAAAAVAAGVAMAQKARRLVQGDSPAGGGHQDPTRWRAVTVNVPPQELSVVPEPLARLDGRVEVRMQPAPGDKGTELAARLTGEGGSQIDGRPALEALRAALRQAKQLCEVGYVLEPDANTTAEPTVLNAPLRAATAHADGEGRL